MRRIAAWLAGVVLLSTVGVAEDRGFIGAEVKYHDIEAQEPVTGNDLSESAAALGLRLGGVNDRFRFYVMYDFIKDIDYKKTTIKEYLATATVDWFIPFQTEKFKPYLGAIVGYGYYEIGSFDDSGVAYGAEGGLMISMGRYDLDGFVRWIGSDVNDVDYYMQAGVGVNYKF